MENAGCANDGGVKKVLLDVCHVEMEGTCCVDHGLERGVRYHRFIERVCLGDIWNDGEVELVGSVTGMHLSNALGLARATDSRDYRMTGMFQLGRPAQATKRRFRSQTSEEERR